MEYDKIKNIYPTGARAAGQTAYTGRAGRVRRAQAVSYTHLGIARLYLITDHTQFYEHCGWEFLCPVTDDEGVPMRIYNCLLYTSSCV